MTDSNLENKQTMCFCTALPCEAKPLVDYYRLRKIETKPFAVYQRDNVWLIVSGVGAISTAMAVSWLAAQIAPVKATSTQKYTSTIWLNVGCAGHAELPLGAIARVSEVRDLLDKRLYPVLLAGWKSLNLPLLTVDIVDEKYPDDGLVDMEGFTFFQAATKIVQTEQVQLIKVVSDNIKHPSTEVTAAGVSALIAPHCETIDLYARSLLDMLFSHGLDYNLSHSASAYDVLLPETIHCTVSQKHQFRRLAQQLTAIGVKPNDWPFNLDDYQIMKPLLSDLEAYVRQHIPVI